MGPTLNPETSKPAHSGVRSSFLKFVASLPDFLSQSSCHSQSCSQQTTVPLNLEVLPDTVNSPIREPCRDLQSTWGFHLDLQSMSIIPIGHIETAVISILNRLNYFLSPQHLNPRAESPNPKSEDSKESAQSGRSFNDIFYGVIADLSTQA